MLEVRPYASIKFGVTLLRGSVGRFSRIAQPGCPAASRLFGQIHALLAVLLLVLSALAGARTQVYDLTILTGAAWLGGSMLAVVALRALSSRVTSVLRFLLITATAFAATRLLWIYLCRTLPASDFAFYFDFARTLARLDSLDSMWRGNYLSAWGYPVILAPLLALFGEHVYVAKALNVFAGLALLLLMYAWAALTFSAEGARVAAMLLVLWISNLAFTSVVASEHVGAALTVAVALLAARSMSSPHFSRIAALGAGLLGGAAFAVRSGAILMLLAAMLAYQVECRPLLNRLLLVTLMLSGFIGVTLLYRIGFQMIYDAPVRGQGAFNLLCGTNVAYRGEWNPEDAERWLAQPSPDEADRDAWEESLRRIRETPQAYFSLMRTKLVRQWTNGDWGVAWSLQNLAPSPHNDKLAAAAGPLSRAAQLHQTVVLALAGIGFWRSRRETGRTGVILLTSFLTAGILLHMVLETQPRYQFLYMPAVLIFAGRGLSARSHEPAVAAAGAPTAEIGAAER